MYLKILKFLVSQADIGLLAGSPGYVSTKEHMCRAAYLKARSTGSNPYGLHGVLNPYARAKKVHICTSESLQRAGEPEGAKVSSKRVILRLIYSEDRRLHHFDPTDWNTRNSLDRSGKMTWYHLRVCAY